MATIKKMEKLKEVNQNLKNIISDLETRLFIENTNNVLVSQILDKK